MTLTNETLNVGDLVRFHTPYADENPNTVYRVVEDRETRVLIQNVQHDSWPIAPLSVVLKTDLEYVRG